MKRIRILVAHSGGELYGADRVLLESVRCLVEAGSTVLVTVPTTGPLVEQLRLTGAEVEICRIPVLRKSALTVSGLAKLAIGSVAGIWRGYRLIRRVRPDVLYVNTITIPLWPILARMLRKPVLVHVHESEKTIAKPLRVALALPLLFSSSLIANSRYSADALGEVIPQLRKRSTVIYNGLPGPDDPAAARQDLGIPLRILYIGRISHRKGVHTLIAAMATAARAGLELQLDIVGSVFPGNESYLNSLHAEVEELGLSHRVTFCGFQPEVWTALAACDVVVVPSEADEPFGDTAVEALLAARPVIVSRTSGLSEAVGGFESVQFFTPEDVDELVNALIKVREDWPEFRSRAIADSVAAAIRYSPSAYGRKICLAIAQISP